MLLPTAAMAQTTTPPNEYIFRDQHNKTCIRMVANITVNFVYENETNGMVRCLCVCVGEKERGGSE